jgi:hypothetical protein
MGSRIFRRCLNLRVASILFFKTNPSSPRNEKYSIDYEAREEIQRQMQIEIDGLLEE